MRKFDWPITSKKKTFREAPHNRRLYFEIQSSSPFVTPICPELGNSLLWHPDPYLQIFLIKKLPPKVHCPSGKWTVGSPHSSPNTTWKKNPPPLPTHKKKTKRKAPSHHNASSHWLHGNFIPKIGCQLFLTWTNSPS